MASLKYDDIYSSLFTKIEAYDFIDLSEEELDEFLCNWLRSAATNPYVRKLFSTVIFDDEISNYRNEITEQRYVYRRDYVAQLDSDDFDWDGYFYKVFKAERDTIFGMDDTLVLSQEQIKFIENKIKGLDLMRYYDEEKPNIFVCRGRW